MRRSLVVAVVMAVVAAGVVAAGCGGSSGASPGPLVGEIDEALAAVEARYGGPQDYFEVSADSERVSVIVAVDGATAAERALYVDGELVGPESVGPASGATFRAEAIEVDPDRVFDELREQLDDPDIVDFAVQGGPDGSVAYDATVRSRQGGTLLVLLGADGRILGTQAE